MTWHKEQQGFVTVARNSDAVNYLELAYLQALNIKVTQKTNKVAVIVDELTHGQLTKKQQTVFDYVIVADNKVNGPHGMDPLVFFLSPYKETVKLESDLLFTQSIDHCWNLFRLRDMVMSVGCQDYRQRISHVRKYRQVFDSNALPDVYNGLMYFRYSKFAADFFRKAQEIFENWSKIQDSIKHNRDTVPTTDVVYGIVAAIMGESNCTIPTADFVNFVHMKPAINGFDSELNFGDVFVTELDSEMIRINNINQYHPVHYYDKTFATQELIEHYERLAGIH